MTDYAVSTPSKDQKANDLGWSAVKGALGSWLQGTAQGVRFLTWVGRVWDSLTRG